MMRDGPLNPDPEVTMARIRLTNGGLYSFQLDRPDYENLSGLHHGDFSFFAQRREHLVVITIECKDPSLAAKLDGVQLLPIVPPEKALPECVCVLRQTIEPRRLQAVFVPHGHDHYRFGAMNPRQE